MRQDLQADVIDAGHQIRVDLLANGLTNLERYLPSNLATISLAAQALGSQALGWVGDEGSPS